MPLKKSNKRMYNYCSFTDSVTDSVNFCGRLWIKVKDQSEIPESFSKYQNCEEIVIEPELSVFDKLCNVISNYSDLPFLVAIKHKKGIDIIELVKKLNNIKIPMIYLPPSGNNDLKEYKKSFKKLIEWWLFQEDVYISVYPVAKIFGEVVGSVEGKDFKPSCAFEEEIFGRAYLSIKQDLINHTTKIMDRKFDILKNELKNNIGR